MKTIGLIGGMSWESTVGYYQIINTVVKETMGGLHSAKCLLYSVDFAEIEACQSSGDWDKSARILTDAAQSLERAGADLVLICTNTMHKVADQVAAGISIPLLHIAEVTAQELLRQDVRRVGLLGTQYTMEQAFYKAKLAEQNIEVLVPGETDRKYVNNVIFQELCLGELKEASRQEFLRIIAGLAEQGAQGVILGCTEIGLLVRQEDTKVLLFDTTRIHAESAARMAVQDGKTRRNS